MKFKKLLSFAAATAMAATALLGSLPMVVSADYSGTAGIEWHLYTSTGVLEISPGSSTSMNDYTSASSAPWYNRRTYIKSVVIKDGVTHVGNYAFGNSSYKFTEVTMADTVTTIGKYAFYQNSSLATVTISDNVTSIGDRAFMSNSALKTVQTTVTSQVTQPKVDASGNPVMVQDKNSDGSLKFENGDPVMVQDTDDEGNPVVDGEGNPVMVQDKNEDGSLKYEQVPVMIQDTETVTTNTKGLPSKLESIGEYAFYYDTAITGLTMPSTVKTIGDFAFQNASKAFEEIVLPNATSIGNYAFDGMTSLKKFSCLSSSLTEIPNYAFRGCTALSDFSITRTLKTIGSYAFQNCTSLTDSFWDSVYQGGRATLSTIKDYAFDGCTGFTSLTRLPSSVKTIDSNAFSKCSNLETVSITNKDLSFGSYVFANCTKLTSVTLPAGITTIPNYMFKNTGLTEYTVPATITSIGQGAFSDCTKLASVTFPSYNLKTIENNAFNGCTALTSLAIPSSVTKLGTAAFAKTGLTFILIPQNVTEIPNNLLLGCTELTSVVFPDTVTKMGDYVFKDDTKLKEVVLPKNLETVASSTFSASSLEKITAHAESTVFSNDSNGVLYNYDKSELIAYPAGRTSSSFSIPSTVETIGNLAFAYAKNLTSISFPTGSTAKLERIGTQAFMETGLRSVTIPITVKEIGIGAFQKCTSMTSLTFTGATSTTETSASKCETIGNSAFSGCTALTSVATPYSLRTIGSSAFSGCTKLATLTLNNGVESIGSSAFENDAAIKAINMPDTVTTIGQKAFKGCSAATTLKISKNIEEIPMETFHSCTSLTAVTIPTGVKTLGNSIFYGCTGLVEASIPNSVTTMGTYMFQNCTSLEKAVVSNKITTVPNNTFYGCTNPELNIYLLGTIATAQSSGLQNVKGTIYVYDDTSYTTVSARKPAAASIKYGANFSQLKDKLAEVAEMDMDNYTDASVSVLESAITIAESVIANYAATQGQADAAVESINKAIKNLKLADNTEAFLDLIDKLEEASELVESDYQESSYAKLAEAIAAADEVDPDATPVGEIKKIIAAIDEAIEGLVPSYAYPDVIKEVYAKAYETFLEGTATANMAGTEKIKVYFDMAPNCAYNQMTEFKFKASVNSIETAEQSAKGSGWPANGTTGHTGTFTLDKPLNEGDQYWFYGYTYNWTNHVFSVRAVEFLNGDDEVIFSTKDVVAPTGDLIAAVEEAKAADTTGADADAIAALEEAIEEAEAILAKELPLPSEMEAAIALINDAVEALKGDQPTPPPSSDPKPPVSDPDPTEPTKTPTTATAAPTTVTPKTTRSPEVVKKDKAAAQKAMKQAKITKLKVKSKAKKKINVTWKKVKKATGYQVQVSAKKNFKKVIFKKDLKKTKLNIKNKKIKSKKTYYVRVRAYATYKDANGKAVKVYSKWNKKLRKVKVK